MAGKALIFAMPVEWLAGIQPGKKIASKQRSQIDWLTRAAALEEKEDWPGLLAWGKQWAKTEPDHSLAWILIGLAYQGLKQFEQAVATYNQALRAYPEFSGLWYNLGVTNQNLNRYDDAIAAYRQALRIKPELADVWYNLAAALYLSGNTAAALRAIEPLRILDPARAEKLFALIVPR